MDTQFYSANHIADIFGAKFEDNSFNLVLDKLKPLTEDFNYACIAGGALVRFLSGEEVFKGDIDIWPYSDNCVKQVEGLLKKEGVNIHKSEFALNFELREGVRKTNAQIITKKPDSIPRMIEDFDFFHCQFAYTFGHQIVTNPAAIYSLATKKLRLSNVTNVPYTLGRALRYKARGFDADEAIDLLAGMICKGISEHRFEVPGMVPASPVNADCDLSSILSTGIKYGKVTASSIGKS